MASGSKTTAALSAELRDGLTGALIEAFRRDGFVVVPDLLRVAELDAFAPAVTRAMADRDGSTERNLWEDDAAVRPLSFHPAIAATAAALIGADAVRLWNDRATFDEPGTGAVGPHRDHDGWPINEVRTVVAWIPLDAETAAHGDGSDPGDASRGRGYVPGSHRIGLRELVSARCAQPDDLLGGDEVDHEEVEPVYVAVPRGAVAFHHGLTRHLVQPNDRARVRRAHSMAFFADGCTRGPGLHHDSVDRTGIELGALIDGPVTPIAWPAVANAGDKHGTPQARR